MENERLMFYIEAHYLTLPRERTPDESWVNTRIKGDILGCTQTAIRILCGTLSLQYQNTDQSIDMNNINGFLLRSNYYMGLPEDVDINSYDGPFVRRKKYIEDIEDRKFCWIKDDKKIRVVIRCDFSEHAIELLNNTSFSRKDDIDEIYSRLYSEQRRHYTDQRKTI